MNPDRLTGVSLFCWEIRIVLHPKKRHAGHKIRIMRISKYSGEPVPVIPMRVPVIPLRVPVIPLRVPVIVLAEQDFGAFSNIQIRIYPDV